MYEVEMKVVVEADTPEEALRQVRQLVHRTQWDTPVMVRDVLLIGVRRQ